MLADFRGDGVPVPAFVKTITIYPRRSIDKLEFRVLLFDINKALKCTSDPKTYPNKTAVEFTRRISPPNEYGVSEERAFFLWFPVELGFQLPSASSLGYDIKLSISDYTWKNYRWWTVIYHSNVPVEVLIKIANAMDQHDIFVDTSMF